MTKGTKAQRRPSLDIRTDTDVLLIFINTMSIPKKVLTLNRIRLLRRSNVEIDIKIYALLL